MKRTEKPGTRTIVVVTAEVLQINIDIHKGNELSGGYLYSEVNVQR